MDFWASLAFVEGDSIVIDVWFSEEVMELTNNTLIIQSSPSNIESAPIEYALLEEDKQTLKLSILCEETYVINNLHLRFDHECNAISVSNHCLSYTSYNLRDLNVICVSSESNRTLSRLNTVVDISSYCFTISALFNIMLGGIGPLLTLLDTLQITYSLVYVDAALPINFIQFLKMLKRTQGIFSPLSPMKIPKKYPSQFQRNGKFYAFSAALSPVLLSYFCFSIIEITLSSLLRLNLRDRCRQLITWARALTRKNRDNFLLVHMYDLLIDAFLNSFISDSIGVGEVLSSILALACIFIVPLLLNRKTAHLMSMKKHDTQEHAAFLDGIDLRSPYRQSFLMIVSFRKYFTAMILVLFTSHLMVQMALFTLISICSMACILVVRPFKFFSLQIFTCMHELSLMALGFMIMFLFSNDEESITYGWFAIAMIVTVASFGIIQAIWSNLVILCSAFRSIESRNLGLH
jgi:hypothetical protein